MLKNRSSYLAFAALLLFLPLFSAGEARAYGVISCIGGKLYVSKITVSSIATYSTGGNCTGATIVVNGISATGGATNASTAPGKSVKRSENANQVFATLKSSSARSFQKAIGFSDRREMAGSPKINDEEILKASLDPKNELVSYRAGDLPAHIEDVFKGDTAKFAIIITVNYGLRSAKCEGYGICSITISFNDDKLESGRVAAKPQTSAQMPGVYDQTRIMLFFTGPLPESGKGKDTIPVSENFVIPESSARQMGGRSVTVLAGDYPITGKDTGLLRATLNIKIE